MRPLDNDKADPVLEPISGQRIRELGKGASGRTAGQLTSPIDALQGLQTPASLEPARIAIKAKGRIVFIHLTSIVAIEAKGNYVLLQQESSSHLLRESISTMEQWLALHGFVRIHRSVLVNAAFVEEIQPWSTGEYILRVRSGREYTVTRTYKQNLHLLAELWLGTEGFLLE